MKKFLTVILSLILLMTTLFAVPFPSSAMYDDNETKSEYEVTPPVGLTLTYNGKEQIGVLTSEGSSYVNYYGYDVIDYKATNAGVYTATAVLWGDFGPQTFVWSDGTTADKKIKFVIKKAPNSLKVKGKTASVKYSKIKKAAQTLTVTKVIKFENKGYGSLSYSKKSGNKKITINKKTGKVTLKKGLKKGTYKVKLNITANGNSNYNKLTKTITVKIKIK